MLENPESHNDATEPATKSPVRRVVLVLLALLVVGALAYSKLRSKTAPSPPTTTDATAGPPAVRVSAVAVRAQPLSELLSTSGTLLANEYVVITSETNGKVREIHFQEGRRVAAGDLLVKIDDLDLQTQLERARFRVELAAQREEQQRKLRDEGILSQEEYERQLSEKNVLESEQRLIEGQLKKTEIRAPFSGTLGLRDVSLGAFVSPQTRLTTLQDIEPIKLDFSLPEKYTGLVRVGQEVTFRLKGDDTARRARIFAIEPSVDAETRSLRLRATSPNPGGTLLPGAFADVEVAVNEKARALVVPSIAIVPELAGKKVFVVVDGKAEPRVVETGIRTDELIEITSGLAEGEQVITSGLLQIKPGAPVDMGVVLE